MRKLQHLTVSIRPSIIAASVLSIATICLIIILSLKNNLIADDFLQSQFGNNLIHHIYQNDSGRISHGLVVQIFYSLFDENAVKIAPTFIILLFVVSCCFVTRLFSNKTTDAYTFGVLFSVGFLALACSLFDFAFFFGAASIYPISIAGTMFLVYLLYSNDFKTIRIISVFVLAVFLALINEVTPLTICIIVAIIAVLDSRPRSKKQLSIYLSVFIIQVIGFLVIYFSPGSTARRNGSYTKIDYFEALQLGIVDVAAAFVHLITNPLSLVIIATVSYLSAYYFKKLNGRRTILTIAALVLLMLVYTFTTNYALGYTSMRVLNIVYLLGYIAIIITFRYFILLPKINTVQAVYIFGCIVAFSMVYMNFIDINRALDMRNTILFERKETIQSSLKESGGKTVSFLPAPLLLNSTQAIDIGYYPKESPKGRWLYASLMNYYHISDKEIIMLRQPSTYCIDKNVYNRFGEIDAKQCGSY